MNREFDEHLIEIVEYENGRLDGRYESASLSLLNKPGLDNQVKDSTQVFKINGRTSQNDSVITLSNPSFPDSVSDAVAKIEAISSILGDKLGRHILSPSFSGEFAHRSYAFWPRKFPISSNRILKRIQITSIHTRVFEWITGVSNTTQAPIVSDEELLTRYIEPLTFVVDTDGLSSTAKQLAEETLRSIETSKFRPISVVQHGDFWYGNILLEKSWRLSSSSAPSFYLIDWGGSNVQGYPFIDALSFLMSITRADSTISDKLVIYARECKLPFRHIINYACAYAGYLGMNRAEFPHERYIETVNTLIGKAVKLSNSL